MRGVLLASEAGHRPFVPQGTGEGARPPGDVGSWKLEAGRGGQVGGSLALSSLSVRSLQQEPVLLVGCCTC